MDADNVWLVHVFNEVVVSDASIEEQQTVFRYVAMLPVGDVEELDRAIEDIGFYTSGVDLFYSVQLNFEDLLRSIVDFTERYTREGVMDEFHMDMVSLSFSRLTLNLLGMFKSFVDHGSATLERKFGAGSQHAEEWKRRLSVEYDRSSAYRLFNNLRNYCQHVGMPPIHFSIEQSQTAKGVSVILEFRRDELLSTYNRWSKHARIDLEEGPAKISLLDTLQEWSISFLKLAQWFGNLRRETATASAEKIVSLRSKFSLPLEGKLALMEEPSRNNQQDGVNLKIRWVSEDKAKNVIDGVPEINVNV